ncbi:HIG1 domain family member 2A-like [Hypanus sabinus]|uniref:HIG1 domain family member 2A-like n=1 Tax=Hypanus sabinus TaxID=79690 RepID=UPI0028C39AB9|nr:HIG1 domain family member 2A-like [Hypanus sabinus]
MLQEHMKDTGFKGGQSLIPLDVKSFDILCTFWLVSVTSPLDLTKPPAIEGFTPLPKPNEKGFGDKFIRRTKDNPFVPIRVLGIAGTLTYGLIGFKHGKTQQSQMLIHVGIFAQGFTVAAVLVGMVATAMKCKEK